MTKYDLSDDAQLLLAKMFGGLDLPSRRFYSNKTWSLRAIEASCELIEGGIITFVGDDPDYRTYFLQKRPRLNLPPRLDPRAFNIFEINDEKSVDTIISALKITGVLNNHLIGCLQTGKERQHRDYIEEAVAQLQDLLKGSGNPNEI